MSKDCIYVDEHQKWWLAEFIGDSTDSDIRIIGEYPAELKSKWTHGGIWFLNACGPMIHCHDENGNGQGISIDGKRIIF